MYKRSLKGWMKHIDFIAVDMISLQIACILAYMLRFDRSLFLYQDALYTNLALILAVVDALTCILFGTMHNVLKRGYAKEFGATLKHAFLVFALLMVFLVSTKTSALYSRIVLYSVVALHIVLGYVFRVMYKHFLRKLVFRESCRSLLIVADEGNAKAYVKKFQSNANELMRVAGLVLVNRDAKGESIGGVSVVENLDTAADYICREWIDEVFIGDMRDKTCVKKLIRQCQEMGVVVHNYLPLDTGVQKKQFVEELAGYTVLTSTVIDATPMEVLAKRLMDIIGGVIGCAAALIVMAIVGPMIKKASPGPILYTQERVGQNGKRFKFYKIRSMYLDADARKAELMDQNRIADGMMFKMDFDPRIIGNQILPDGTKKRGIGAWIRDTSLDEFPQFFNVLKGDMSLVGTRPPTVDEWNRYKLHHRMRLAMKPGITGMWQVSGRSQITDFEEIVKLDTQYICNWSLGLDWRILWKTVKVVIGRQGAM